MFWREGVMRHKMKEKSMKVIVHPKLQIENSAMLSGARDCCTMVEMLNC